MDGEGGIVGCWKVSDRLVVKLAEKQSSTPPGIFPVLCLIKIKCDKRSPSYYVPTLKCIPKNQLSWIYYNTSSSCSIRFSTTTIWQQVSFWTIVVLTIRTICLPSSSFPGDRYFVCVSPHFALVIICEPPFLAVRLIVVVAGGSFASVLCVFGHNCKVSSRKPRCVDSDGRESDIGLDYFV